MRDAVYENEKRRELGKRAGRRPVVEVMCLDDFVSRMTLTRPPS